MAKIELLSAQHWNRISGGENEEGTGRKNLVSVLKDENEEGTGIIRR